MKSRTSPSEGTLTRSRREVKILLDTEEAHLLTGRLMAELSGPTPPVTGVVSVYLDRADRALSRRVLTHPSNCLKLRTKEYAPDVARDARARVVLEAKRERPGLTSKRRVWLERERLVSGEGAGGWGLAGRLVRGVLEPVLAVSYARTIFQADERWRVTMDRDVAFHPICRARACGPDKLSAARLPLPFARSDRLVLEVKFTDPTHLPVWLVRLVESRHCAFSKFTEGLRQQAAHLRGENDALPVAEEGARRVHRL